jgi:photosystem II stability/assembly factor-like uncharacterized protein
MRPAAIVIGFVFVAALGLVGCADGKSVVTVTLDAEQGDTFDVASLRVVPSDSAGRMDTITVPVGRTIPPAYELGLRFDASVRGSIHVDVQALDGTGAPIGAAAGDVVVAPSKSLSLPLTLRRVIGPPPGSSLAFVVQPSDAIANGTIKPPVQVAVKDAGGATVTTTNASITVALGANPANGRLAGTLTVAAVNGVATFADLSIDMNGDGYTLVASSTGVTGATSTPFNVRAPVWAPATNGIFGGTVTALASDRGSPITLYAGTSTSGVYKSTNLGQTWVPVVNGLTTLAINGLAVDPTNAQVAWATTDNGIWKTVNGGASWTLSYVEPSTPWYAIAVDPASPSTVYAGSFGKVVKTTNGGASWSDDSSGFGSAASGLAPGRISSLAVSGANVYLTGYNNFMSGGGLWKQTGGGAWAKDAGMAGIYPNSVAVSPTNASVILVGTDGGLWGTTNGGTNWSQRVAGSPNFYGGGVAKVVAFDPSDGNVVYVGSSATGVYKSSDGGTTWSAVNQSISDQAVSAIVVDKNSGANVFAGLKKGVWKSMASGFNWFDSSAGLTALPVRSLATTATAGTLYAGTWSGGVFKTIDGGQNWAPASGSGAMALPARDQTVSALVADPASPSTVLAGVNRGGVWRTTDGGTSWADLSGGGLGGDIYVKALAQSPQNTMVLYAGTDFGTLYKTANGGGAWTNGNLTGASFVAVVCDPTSASTVYAASTAVVSKTTTGGTSWAPITTGLPAMVAISSLAMEGASTSALWLGLQSGAVYRSIDAGASWSATAAFSTKPITAIATHPTRAGVALAGTGGDGVFYTTDGGATWRALNGGLESLSIGALAYDRGDATVAYAGTVSGGVYRATIP